MLLLQPSFPSPLSGLWKDTVFGRCRLVPEISGDYKPCSVERSWKLLTRSKGRVHVGSGWAPCWVFGGQLARSGVGSTMFVKTRGDGRVAECGGLL